MPIISLLILQILAHFVTIIFRDIPAMEGLFIAMLYSGALRFAVEFVAPRLLALHDKLNY